MSDENKFYIDIYHTFIVLNQYIENLMEKLNIDLSYGQYVLLKYISMSEGKKINQKAVFEFSYLRKATVSQHLKALTKKGYILHYSSKVDSRRKVIIMTAKGKQCVKSIDIELSKTLTEKYTDKDIKQSLKVFKKVMEGIKDDKEISKINQRV